MQWQTTDSRNDQTIKRLLPPQTTDTCAKCSVLKCTTSAQACMRRDVGKSERSLRTKPARTESCYQTYWLTRSGRGRNLHWSVFTMGTFFPRCHGMLNVRRLVAHWTSLFILTRKTRHSVPHFNSTKVSGVRTHMPLDHDRLQCLEYSSGYLSSLESTKIV